MHHRATDFLAILEQRGFLHQCSDREGLEALLREGGLRAYVGYDCTAPSLHAGSLVSILMLHWLQQTGGTPIVLMGGGTTRIGDPSGRDETRKVLSEDEIEANKRGIQQVFSRFITFGNAGALMVDNADWLLKLPYLDFLRETGRHFSVNRMLSFDSVRMRLEREQELSFIEFNYMILQAYDFVELARRHDCRLQMGGSDQWGNIVSGIDLGRRMGTPRLTCPLLTTSSGAKMGKTASGAVWLNADRLPAYEYWQYWRNCEDADIARFLRLYTLLPLDEIARLAALQGAEINEAKKVLATETTALLHGREAAEQAAETARLTFEEGTSGQDLPSLFVSQTDLTQGIGLLTLFVESGLVPSTGEARRQIRSGGLRLNDTPVTNERQSVTAGDFNGRESLKLSFGRKKHVLVKIRS
jgi:tyrosyl-tRNA synthetase